VTALPLSAAFLERDRITTLARHLAAATTAGAAEWSAREPELYAWGSVAGIVTIASRDRDGDPPYELVVYNAAKERVDELSSELLENDEPAPWNGALAELHRAARRNALNADDVIEALIGALPKVAEPVEPELAP
jgi:hypothetical protein